MKYICWWKPRLILIVDKQSCSLIFRIKANPLILFVHIFILFMDIIENIIKSIFLSFFPFSLLLGYIDMVSGRWSEWRGTTKSAKRNNIHSIFTTPTNQISQGLLLPLHSSHACTFFPRESWFLWGLFLIHPHPLYFSFLSFFLKN